MLTHVVKAFIGVLVLAIIMKLSGMDVPNPLKIASIYDEVEASIEDSDYDSDYDYNDSDGDGYDDYDSGYEYEDYDYDY